MKKEVERKMEIERKFLIEKENLPDHLEQYPHDLIEQAYIITQPVLRVRRKNDTYILTYKGPGFMQREEVEFPLEKEAYERLLLKADGNLITKTRYKIPEANNLLIELDVFSGLYDGLYLAEVEFSDIETATNYIPPTWFGTEVTQESTYHNSTLSNMSKDAILKLLKK